MNPQPSLALHPCVHGLVRLLDGRGDAPILEHEGVPLVEGLRRITDKEELRHALFTLLAVAADVDKEGRVELADSIVHLATQCLGKLEADMAAVLEGVAEGRAEKLRAAVVGETRASNTRKRDEKSAAVLSIQKMTWLR